tara:strand:+ start:67 stop:672 length:606 start_codon:yes stop_codon:yes gene_type:complete
MHSTWDNVAYFEDLLAEYTGAKYGVATDSCTNAIFLSLQYLKTNSMPHVEVPQHTYPSVPMMVKHAGLELKFVDKKWYGMYQLMPYPIYDSAVRFTEDMFRDGFSCLSFHYKKYIPIGRGGMILTDDKDAVDWLKQARYDGRSTMSFAGLKDIAVCGWHMYMTPEQAARGIELFYRLPKENDNLSTWKDYPDVSKFSCFKY